ncbi:MAG: retropepsin-like aspartic protease [Sphingomonadaceae bacterium]
MRLRALGRIIPIVLIAALGACTTQPLGRNATAAEALCALGYISIPLRTLASGHHIVAGSINGVPATFVVDSGAGRTVVHSPYVAQFFLDTSSGEQGTAIGAGGSTAVSAAPIRELMISTTRTSLERVYAMDLTHVVNALDSLAGDPIHGIVGQDVMQAQHAIIDVQEARLYLKPIEVERQTFC